MRGCFSGRFDLRGLSFALLHEEGLPYHLAAEPGEVETARNLHPGEDHRVRLDGRSNADVGEEDQNRISDHDRSNRRRGGAPSLKNAGLEDIKRIGAGRENNHERTERIDPGIQNAELFEHGPLRD